MIDDWLAFAVVCLGLSLDDARSLTLKQLQHMRKLWEVEQQKQDYRAGIIASTLANCHADRKKRPRGYRPSDFMPSLKAARPKVSRGLNKQILTMISDYNNG